MNPISKPHPVQGGPVVQMPTPYGIFQAQAWTDELTGVEHLAVSRPSSASTGTIPLVRLHSECLTGDILGSYRCDCGEQLAYAMNLISRRGGALIYLRGHEGRGIGLANKIRAYALQELGHDTIEANELLGLPVDSRSYDAAAQILIEMGLNTIQLLTNNPDKQDHLTRSGISVVGMVPAELPFRDQNLHYLTTKKERMKHRLTLQSKVLIQ